MQRLIVGKKIPKDNKNMALYIERNTAYRRRIMKNSSHVILLIKFPNTLWQTLFAYSVVYSFLLRGI